MKRIITSLVLFVGFMLQGNAQVLLNQCESTTPCSARSICGNTVVTNYSYTTAPAFNPMVTCASSTGTFAYASNWVYYRFTCYTTGTLNFRLNSNDSASTASDLDWALWDITTTGCGSLTTIVECNAAGNGATGILTGGLPAANFEPNVTITAGNIYIIGISNPGGGNTSGFTLNFNGSTANISDNKKPYLLSVAPFDPCSPVSFVKIRLSEPVRCDQIGPAATSVGGADLNVSGLATSSFTVTPLNCSGCSNPAPNNSPAFFGNATDSIKIDFGGNMAPGTYTVTPIANQFFDLCGKSDSTTVSLVFTVPAPFKDSIHSGFDCVAMKYLDTVRGVNGLSPYQYKAVGGGLPVSAGTFTASMPGYTVYAVSGGTPVTYTVKDAGGCTLDTTLNRPSVLALGAPNLSVSSNPPCHDQFSLDSISVVSQSGGVGPYSFVCTPTYAGTIYSPSVAAPTKWKNLVFPGLGTTFTITVTDANGCTKTGLKNLVNPTLLVMPTPSVTNPLCFGDSTGKLCFNTATTGTPNFLYSMVPMYSNATFTTTPNYCFNNLPAGTYTLTVSDANSCIGTTTKVLSQPAVIAINTTAATIVAPTCPNNCNGTYQPIATGGTGGKKFYKLPYNAGLGQYADSVVSSVAPNNKFLNLCAGTYTILAKDAQNCTVTATVTLSLPPKPHMNIGAITPVACFGGTGTIPVTITNGTPTYTAGSYMYQPSPVSGMTTSAGGPGGTIGSYTSVPAGTYNLIIMNANGCSDTAFGVVMTQPPAPVTYSSVVVDSVLCFGSATGQITAQATGGTLGANSYEYAIKFGAGAFSAFSAPTLAPYVFTSLVAGTYTIRVRDHNLCSKDTVVTVKQPTKLDLLVSSTTATCFGTTAGQICVVDTGGVPGYRYKLGIFGTYSAFQPAGSNFCYNTLAAGSYFVFTIDSKGCLDTVAATIASIPLPIVSFTATPYDTVCNGTAITLCGTGADTYTWTGGIFDCTAITATLGAHQYIVTGTNTTTGCKNKDTADVLINPIPVLTDPTDQVRCNNTATAAVNFISSVPNSTFSWVNNTPSIGLLASGTGSSIPPFLAQNTTNLPVVATITVTATGPAPDFCVGATQSFTITVNPDAFISLTSAAVTNAQTLCINDVLTDITYAVSGGGTGATVSGLPAGIFGTFSGGVMTIHGSPSGPAGVYPYTVTTTGTCLQSSASGTITINPDATLSLSSPAGTNAQTLCINTTLFNITYAVGGTGNNGTVAGLPTGVTGAYAGGVVTISGSPSVSGLFTYTVTATGTCANATTTGTINVTPLQNPAFSYPSSTYCQTGVNPSPTITGTPGGTFSYTGPGTLQLNPSTGLVTLISSNLGTYTIKYVTNGPCPDSSTFLFTITLAPTAGFSYASASYCQNGTDPLPVFAPGASAGVFSALPATLSFVSTGTGQIDLSASASGTYTVTNFIAAAGGCAPASASTVVTIDSTTILTDPANQIVCDNTATAAVTFISTVGGSTYGWVNDTPSIGLLASGTGNIPPFIAQNTSAVPVVATITVTPTGPAPDFCTGLPQSFTITVKPHAFISLTSAAGTDAQTLCINDVLTDITYAVSGGGTGATVSGLPAGLFGTFSGGVMTIHGSPSGPAGVYAYTVTTTGTCAQTSASGTITVSPDATLSLSSAVGTNAQTLCINTTLFNISYAVGGTGTFGTVAGLPTGVNGSYAGGVVTISGSPSVSGLFTYTVTATGTCANATTTGTINVTPLQNPSFSYPLATYCETGTDPSPTITGTMGGTFSATPIGLSINAGTGQIDLSLSGANTYTVKYVTNGPCPDSSTVTITIIAPPTADFSYASASYCQNGINPSAILAPGASAGVFSSTSGLTILNPSSGKIDLPSSASGTYTVTNFIAAAGGCAPASASTVVTIDSTTILTDPANQIVCDNTATAAVTFISTVGGSTYGWVNDTPSIGLLASGTGNIPPFIAQNTSAVPVVATITVTPTGPAPDFCTGLPQSFTITVKPHAFISLTSAAGTDAQTLCINDVLTDITYAVSGGGTGATVSGLPAGLFGTFSGGVMTIHGSPSGPAGVYAYTVTTTGTCAQTSASGTITVSPDATLSLSSAVGTNAQTLCINTTLFNISYAVGGTGTFGTVAGLPTGVNGSYAGGVVTISGSPSVSGLFTYTVTATGTCANATTTGTINVTPLQNPAFSYTLSTYCQTGVNPTPTITSAGGTFSYTGPGTLQLNTSTGLVTLNTSNLGTYTIKYVTSGPCPDSSTVNLTITTAPTAGFSYASASYCQNGTDPSPVFAAGASAGVFSAVPATLVFISTTTGQIDLSLSPAGTYTVTNFIAAGGGCAAATATTVVTIDPTTILTDPADQVRCNNSPTAAVNFITTVPQTTIGWTHNATAAIGIPTSGTGNIPSFIPVNTGSTPIVVTFTVNPTGPAPNFCTGLSQQFTLTINPDAKLILTSAAGTNVQSVCINTPITTIAYATGGSATSANMSGGLAPNLTGVYTPGVMTISGSPNAPGTYTYSVTATGTCASTTATGTITVNPNATLTLTSSAASTNQNVCRYVPITNITYTVGATGNNSTVTGLPPGVTSAGTTSVTISGTPNVPGTYTYTVTATGTCGPATSTGTIVVNPLQDPTFTYPNPTNCQFGTTSPNVLVTPGGTFSHTGVGTLSINTSTGVINLGTSSVGVYTIKYVTPGPCKDSTTLTITITNAPSAQFHYASSNYCQSAANPSPIYNGPPTPSSGGVYTSSGAGLVFAVSPPALNGTIDLLASTPGTYDVYNTIAASGVCPSVADTFTVTITSKPTLSFVSSTQAWCNPNCNGTVTTSVAGGNGVYNYTIAPGGVVSAAGVASSLCAGTVYTITVTDGIGCTGTLTATVTTTPSPTVTAVGVNTSAPFATDGTALATPAGGSGSYTFSIAGTGSPSINAAGAASNLQGGPINCITYTITVTDSHGCTGTTTVCIYEPGALICNQSHTNVSCFGGSNGTLHDTIYGGTVPYTLVSATGPLGPIVFSPAVPVNVISATGLPAGNYTVTWKDAANIPCSNIITITEPAVLSFTAPVISTPSCSPGCDGTLTITATGGTGTKVYSITSPAGMTCNALPGAVAGSFNVLGVGTYTILVTDANNCTKTTTVQINASPNPTVNLNHINPLCHDNCNGSIVSNAGAGTPAFTYAIVSPAGAVCVPTQSSPASGNFTTLGGGTYTVVVSDSKGCTVTGTQILVNPAALYLNPPVTVSPSCNGSCNGSVTLSGGGGTPGYTYSLTTPLTTNATGIFNLLCAGTYTVSVKDTKNCTSSGTVQLTDPPILTWTTTTHTNITCNGSGNGTISTAATGGTGTIEYSRNNGVTYFPSGNFTSLSAGTYTIIAKDANNCTITTSFTIIEPPVLTLGNPTVVNVSCNGANDGTISITAGGGTPGYTYLLTPTSATNTTGNFTNLAANTYTVKVTDAAGCTKSVTSILITQPAPLVFTLVNHQDVACFGESTGTITVNSQGGTPAITYSLVPNIGTQGPTGFFSGLPAGTYTVKAKDAHNCIVSSIVTITQGPQIIFLDVTMTEPICHGDANGSISFTVIGGTGQLKFKINGGPLQTDTVFNDLLAGNYLLTVVDALACSKDTMIVVTEPEPVGAILNLQGANCVNSEDGKAIIIGTGGRGGYKYYLTPGLHINKSGIFVGLPAGTYLLRVVDTAGCEYRTNITINPPANPLANTITKQDLACNGVGNEGTATANVAGGTPPYTFMWNTKPPQTTAKASTLYFGYYDVTVTDANGCEVKDTVYIEEGPCCEVAFIPNAFSPNGDQVNDEFRVLTTAGVELIQLEIYNRWGKRVWSTIDYRRGWDGTIDGKDAAIDTYYYILRYKCTRDNGTYTKKGDLILIR